MELGYRPGAQAVRYGTIHLLDKSVYLSPNATTCNEEKKQVFFSRAGLLPCVKTNLNCCLHLAS